LFLYIYIEFTSPGFVDKAKLFHAWIFEISVFSLEQIAIRRNRLIA